jgi:hypothetical protein
MPAQNSVLVTIKYNGYLHDCVGLRGDCRDRTVIHVFGKDLPKGYFSEHNTLQFDLHMGSHCLTPDTTGKAEWRCTELFDRDAFSA